MSSSQYEFIDSCKNPEALNHIPCVICGKSAPEIPLGEGTVMYGYPYETAAAGSWILYRTCKDCKCYQ